VNAGFKLMEESSIREMVLSPLFAMEVKLPFVD
jgi:hypothetical protein